MSFYSTGTYPKKGQKVKIRHLGPTTGWSIDQQWLKTRRANITGIAKGHVPGHGGDVWWVVHDDGNIAAAYGIDEMEPANG